MSRKDAYLDHLSKVPMFRGLSRKHLEVVGKQGSSIQVAAGDTVIREGEHGEEFFVVLSGKLSVTAGGTEFAVLGDGDFFGELALFDPAPRDATVTAVSASELLVIGVPAVQPAARGRAAPGPQGDRRAGPPPARGGPSAPLAVAATRCAGLSAPSRTPPGRWRTAGRAR
jgi:hypothetical protein